MHYRSVLTRLNLATEKIIAGLFIAGIELGLNYSNVECELHFLLTNSN